MKRLALFVLSFSLVQSSQAQFEKQIRGSEVTGVRIYQSGSQVERTVSTSVEAGTTTLLVEGLSAAVDPQSIYVTGTGSATVAGISYRLDYLSGERKPAEVRRLEDSLRILNSEIEKINALELVYIDEMALMNANRSVGGANTGVDVDILKEVADYFRERMIDLRNRQIDVKNEQRKLKERQERMNKQLSELNAKYSRPQGTIVIDVLAAQAAKLNLKVVYYTSGASWTPSYDISAVSLSKPVRLAYKANVVQTCNEEWENVHIVLSTGNPSVGGQKPVLNPWYLNFYQPVPISDRKAARAPMMMGEAAPAVMMAEDAISTMEQYVTVAEGAMSTDFDISQPYTIRGDGKPVVVEIRSHELPAAYLYYAAPKIDQDAFLLARVSGWDRLDLLPGDAKVYYEGNYVGESYIDPRSAPDTLDLSLGRDKRIIVKREAKSEMTKSRTAGGNTVREQYFGITVRNTRKEPIALLLEDQLPVSQNSDIKVSDREYSDGTLDESTGKVTWRLDVPAGGVESRTIGYTVKYPRDRMVTGF
jgi:uncharacterized protein (TIGR02231 family)